MRRLLTLALIAVLAVAGIVAYDAFREQHTSIGPSSAQAPVRSDAQDTRYIRSVTSQRFAEGVVFNVHPTRAGRVAVGDALDDAWREAVAKGVPDRAGLRQQFMCHPVSVVARAKQSWDLETWRPTVGLLRTMLNGCNP